MPHAALIVAAVTAGVGSAVAFEVGIFKPWREEHWPNGIRQGIKQEWELFAEDVREGFREISGDRNEHRFRQQGRQHRSDQHNRSNSDAEDERELRREMDEFSMHEAQSSSVKARFAQEFEEEGEMGGARRRKLQGASSMDAGGEDRLIDAPQLGYHSSQLKSNDYTWKETEAQSPHHDIGEASPSATNVSLAIEEDVQSFHAGSDGWRSPRSNTISEEWQSHLSPRESPHISGDEVEEDGSETWTQLDDSRSVSPSWSVEDVTGSNR